MLDQIADALLRRLLADDGRSRWHHFALRHSWLWYICPVEERQQVSEWKEYTMEYTALLFFRYRATAVLPASSCAS